MRTVIAVVALTLVAGCGASSAADSYSVTPQAQRILTRFWHEQGNYTTKGYMKATCKDLRQGGSPGSEVLALTNAKRGASVRDAESLVVAAVRTVCPKAAKIPKAWR